MIYLCIGVDPSAIGSKGGIVATLTDAATKKVLHRFFCDFSTKETIVLFLIEVKNIATFYEVADKNIFCAVENIWGRPSMSVRTVSAMMQGQGFILGALMGVFHNLQDMENIEVLPELWQRDIKKQVTFEVFNNLSYSQNKTQLHKIAKCLFEPVFNETILPTTFSKVVGLGKINRDNCDAFLISHYLCLKAG